MQIYVNEKAAPGGTGTEERPYQRISDAASIARPGDEVLVAPGVYRENVDPRNAGTADARIVYRSVRPLAAVITGAEPLSGWQPVAGHPGVWTARVGNGLFGSYNPYTTLVQGDWFMASFRAHTGDVFLNDKSMYEVTDLSGVYAPEEYRASWDRAFSVYTWHAAQDPETDETVFTANFHQKDPNAEKVEITVRENCFYPQKEGVGYITLSGFTVCKAATQWAPPTAYQEGMIGPHWSKGWIIEDCDISESKCSGISLGKYLQKDNDNKWLHEKYKDGTQTERECILEAQRDGWSKETVGSHIIRRCSIHDCGQTGIVGHLGGVFSVIEDNHIFRINNKQNLAGAEIGGIKMHAAIDVIIRRNHIHHCTRGLWLDWQAQGTRVTQNLFHDNTLPVLPEHPDEEEMAGMGEDIFVEVSHGPTLIDNNLLLSDRAFKAATQGFALVHNLIAGSLVSVGIGTDNGAKTLNSSRYTPYHVPHRTEVAGFMTFLHGDDRFCNNIFIQKPMRPALKAAMERCAAHPNCWDDCNVKTGTFPFDGYPTFAEWNRQFAGECGMGSAPSDRYYSHLPVWASGNLYLNGAQAWEKETEQLTDDTLPVTIAAVPKKEADGTEGWYLSTNLAEVLEKLAASGKKLPRTSVVSTETLGKAFEPEQRFENPDGTEIIFDADYFGRHRGTAPMPGPFAESGEISEKLV